MKKLIYYPQRLPGLKIAAAVLLILLILTQITVGCWMLHFNDDTYSPVTREQYDTLQAGQSIQGFIMAPQVEKSYEDLVYGTEHYHYLLLRTPENKLLMLCASQEQSPECYERMLAFEKGSIRRFEFKGKVTAATDRAMVSAAAEMSRQFREEGSFIQEEILPLCIEALDTRPRWTTGEIFWVFAGALPLLALLYLMLRKFLLNGIYQSRVRRGKIIPKLKISREDLILENEGTYTDCGVDEETGSFYVNSPEVQQPSGSASDSDAPSAQKRNQR